jgi:hypothetical protein
VLAVAVAGNLSARSEARVAFCAGVPFTVWALLAFLLDPPAKSLVSIGLLFFALWSIAAWVVVVLRSKGDESPPGGGTWVRAGRAMVYVGPTDERR